MSRLILTRVILDVSFEYKLRTIIFIHNCKQIFYYVQRLINYKSESISN